MCKAEGQKRIKRECAARKRQRKLAAQAMT
jgi:hypothetical protein